jgi:branched-chain amino acid transport system ATP-binding protein
LARSQPLVAAPVAVADRDLDLAADDGPVVELRGVRAAYGTIEVLHGIDLTVAAGSILAILGPNGAGKSSVLKVMSGGLKPTAGAVLMEGHDVTGTPPDRLAKAGVCLIPEGRGVFPNLTVRENLLMDTFACDPPRPTAELEEVAYARFPRLGERRSQLAGTLSGGEQQMLALAHALTTDPAVILLDELSMGLAPTIVSELFDVVRGLAADGVTTVVVEQFAGVTAFADWVAVMAHGQIRLQGTPAEIDHQLASAYLGGAPSGRRGR